MDDVAIAFNVGMFAGAGFFYLGARWAVWRDDHRRPGGVKPDDVSRETSSTGSARPTVTPGSGHCGRGSLHHPHGWGMQRNPVYLYCDGRPLT